MDADLTADGDLLVAGIEVALAESGAFVARFDLQQFQPDAGFGDNGMARFKFEKVPQGQEIFTAITVLDGGDVLAAGPIDIPDGKGLAVVQLDAVTGTVSPEFNGGVPKTYDPCLALPGGCSSLVVNGVARTAGHVIVSGWAQGLFAARFTGAGDADAEFGQQGLVRIELNGDTGTAGMAMQEERIVLAGSVDNGESADFMLLRLSDGRLFNDQFETGAP